MKGWKDIVVPPSHVHVWNAWLDITFTSGYWRKHPLVWTEFKAFLELTGTELSPQDVNMVREMDSAYLGSIN